MPASACCKLELLEDRVRAGIALRRAQLPLRRRPGVQLAVALVRVEHVLHHELRRDRAVPAVLLRPERNVVTLLAPEPVDLAAEIERNRAARVAAVAPHAEARVLPL